VNRYLGTLFTLLLIQCGMVATLYWPHSDALDINANESLLPFDPDRIDEIYIEDTQGNEAVLVRMSDHWLMPDLAGMPIDTDRVDKLITSLSHRTGEWPVATTESSRQRFQVAAYHHQRRLTLIGEGVLLGTIYLGTSPGFRQVHARNDAQDAIYSIPYNTYDAPADIAAWLDKTLLQIEHPQKISSEQYILTKVADQWVLAAGGQPDERELAALVAGLGRIQVEGIADEDTQRILAIAGPELDLNVETADGAVNLQLFRVGESHFIRSSKYNYFFTLSAYDFDRLAGIYVPALTDTL
jgi:hypothetical protein